MPGVLATVTPSGLQAAASQPPASAEVDPAALVHPLDGTATGPVSPGTVGEFPGADVPFGMLQWSPDTSPDTVQAGGGYDYEDSSINGFSLTHLSGTGCPSYQDVPILPTEGTLATPATTVDRFSHGQEHASPGRYQVTLGGRWTGIHPRLTRRHHAIGHFELHLPGRHRVQSALQGGGQQQPGHSSERPRRGPRRGGGPGLQRENSAARAPATRCTSSHSSTGRSHRREHGAPVASIPAQLRAQGPRAVPT